MATFANAVQQECLSNGRVGGYYDIPNGAPVRVEISHTWGMFKLGEIPMY